MADGSRMTPTHATKKAKRYRYYVSASFLAGDRLQARKGMRIPAGDIERLVLDRLRAFLTEISDALAPLDLDAQTLDAALRNIFKLSERWFVAPEKFRVDPTGLLVTHYSGFDPASRPNAGVPHAAKDYQPSDSRPGRDLRPPGDDPFRAIMILHGSGGRWSGWSHCAAAIFAAHGFLAFPFGYSKGGNFWNAGNIIDVPLDKTAEALLALRKFPVAGKKVGLYGVSRGAEHALLLASLMARDGIEGIPDAIAAHSPLMSSAAGSMGAQCGMRAIQGGNPGILARAPGRGAGPRMIFFLPRRSRSSSSMVPSFSAMERRIAPGLSK
jgi:hypothetical protein